MFYEVITTKTVRFSKGICETYGQDRKVFDSKEEVATYLTNEYYHVQTTIPTYHDDYTGQTGRIFAWKQREDGKTVYYQDWVNVYETTRTPVLVNRQMVATVLREV